MNLRFVHLGDVDLDDRSFEIRRFSASPRLEESLARFGILDPPWLRERQGKYIAVDGFKRLRWAKENGFEGTFCRIFPENLPDRDLWDLRVEKKLFERELDIAEKARIVSVLLSLYPPGEVPAPFLSGLDVAGRPEILARWASVSTLDPESLEIIASGAIGERAALELTEWDDEGRHAVLDILRSLRCSAAIQVEIVERFDEIAVRDRKSRMEVMESPPVKDILSSSQLDHRRKTQVLRDILSAMRFPRLDARKKRFIRDMESLRLPPRIRIVPPPAFEGTGWKMELSFTGPEELRKTFDSAGPIVGSDRLASIMGLGQTPDEDEQGR